MALRHPDSVARTALLGALLLALGCAAGCSKREPQPQRLALVQISAGGRTLSVEAARTSAEQEIGMMHRLELQPDEGMLFVFPGDRELAFYMKNTHVPLSIAFIRADGVIANIAHMEPESLVSHFSRLQCRYALEMPQGWFARNNVREGDIIRIPAGVTAQE